MKAYIGIGTNIGNREENIKAALTAINHLPGTEVAKVSAVYETEPWGYTQQDNFYNICAEVETALSAKAFLGACLGIEAAFGRERPFKNAPRIIDIDLLLYKGITMNEAELTVPHPRIGERAFVMVPLKDVLMNLALDDADYNDEYNKCDKSGVNKLFNIDI